MTRTPSESDGRVVHVSLTDEGRRLIDRALPDHIDTENRLLAALTPAQRDALASTLRDLLESLGDTTEPNLGRLGAPHGAHQTPNK